VSTHSRGTLTKEHTLAQIHLVRAHELDDQQAYEKALSECDAALRLAPDFADAHNLRGVLLEELGQQQEAVTAYQEAIRLDPGFEEAKENLAAAKTTLPQALDLRSGITCTKCSQLIPEGREILLKGNKPKSTPLAVCKPCANALERLYQAETEDLNLAGGLVLGFGAAIMSSLIWFGFVVVTNYQVGLIAIGVGWLIGQAVVRGAGQKRSPILQAGSLGITLIAMCSSEYLIVRHFGVQALADQGITGIPLILPIEIILDILREGVINNPSTLLYWALAGWTAYHQPARRKLSILSTPIQRLPLNSS